MSNSITGRAPQMPMGVPDEMDQPGPDEQEPPNTIKPSLANRTKKKKKLGQPPVALPSKKKPAAAPPPEGKNTSEKPAQKVLKNLVKN